MVVKYTFDDGEVIEVDATKVLRSLADQHLVMGGLLDQKASLYRAQADLLDRRHRSAIAAKGAEALQRGTALTHEELRGQVRSVLANGNDPRNYVMDWAKEHEISDDTVRRQIQWVRDHPIEG
jgi:hypothetical protein